MKDEIYSYLVSSISLLNQSIKKQDTKNLKLFSYLYNNYLDIDNNIQNVATNENMQILSYCIVQLDNNVNKIDKQVTLLGNKMDEIIKSINGLDKNISIQPVDKQNALIYLFEKFGNMCIIIFNWIKHIFMKIYKYSYNIIFYWKIKKEKEEQKRKEQEEIEKQLKEKQRIIRNILQGNK